MKAGLIAKTLIVLFVAIFGLPTILWLAQFFDVADRHNLCNFGFVSNADYEKLVRDARLQNWTVWPGLSSGIFEPSDHWFASPSREFADGVGKQLFAAVNALTPYQASPDFRLAATHAVLRSIGATYDNTTHIPERLSTTTPRAARAHFNYHMPQSRFAPVCIGCFIWRHTTIHVNFVRDSLSDTSELERIVVLFSGWKYAPNIPHQKDRLCPTIQDLEALRSTKL